MNSIIESLNLWGERFVQFAWPMLWQSSVLIAILFVLDFIARRKVRAAVRYALWLVVMVKLLLPSTLAVPTSIAWWVRPNPPPKKQSQQYAVTYLDRAQTPTTPNLYEGFTAGALPGVQSRLSPAGWFVVTSGSISLTLLVWMLLCWRHVARMVRTASPAAQESDILLDDNRHRIGLRRTVRLRLTDLPMSPAVCGLFRPVILLPGPLADHLPPSQLRAVLLHELVHLKRGDVWVNCAQALLQIVYWWHPLLWLANARIRRVREEAVDDAVMLALREEAETYPPTLLEVAKLALNRPLASLGLVGIMESHSALRQRIERLVDFRPPRKAGLTIASALCVLAFAVLAVPMEQAPATRATQISTPKQTESARLPPVAPSNGAEEVKLRVIVLNKRVAGDAARKRKLAEDIVAKVKGGAAFSEMATVFSEGWPGREGGDWGWVQKYDRDGGLVLRKELADAAFSLKPGEVSEVIETPEMICLMLVEDKLPAHIEATQLNKLNAPKQSEHFLAKSHENVIDDKANEEVKLRVIVLNIPVESDAPRVRKRAEEIRAQVKRGAAFSEMATVNSEGRQRDQGGDWGWIQKYDVNGALVLRKELAEAAFALKPGEMSEVIDVGYTCYLMLVEDKRAAHTSTHSK